MKLFGLIGYPLGHSFSKTYFTQKFKNEKIRDCRYENFPVNQIDLLTDLVDSNRELVGLNVTIPYKKKVIPFLDELDDEAAKIGAVNTIKIIRMKEQVKLKGFNTDVFGFEQPLTRVLKPYHNSALIFGTGGASQAVAYILRKHKIQHTYVSRNPKIEGVLSYEDITRDVILNNTLLINTSPLGMHPRIDACPDIPYDAITSRHILYDLIYNPEKTLFLQKGEESHAVIINGLSMLHLQAEKSWQIWTTKSIV